ncbi:uroporphyrinogen decarboxylase [Candidatus Puniceispirillum sp.]|nr:uroporphyrinogen decarboxylase [Candidatus Puniceispirillum sp.]
MIDKLFLSTITGNKSQRTPIWMMRQAGRYLKEYQLIRSAQKDFITFCLNPEKASTVTVQPITRYAFDAAIIFSDILIVPWAMNRDVRFQTGIGPLLNPMVKPDDINKSCLNDFEQKLLPVGEAIKLTKALLPKEIALIGFAGAPWTLITYMAEGKSSRDFQKARLWAWQDAKALDGLLEILIEATILFLCLQARSGAECLMLFDSWASAVPASQRDWLVTKPTAAIVKGVRKQGYKQPIIGFPKGFGDGLINFANESGVDAIGLDHSINPMWAEKNLPKNLPVQGNLDPISLLGSGKEMFRDIDNILEAFHNRPHIFNLGHGITPQTPVENVQIMIDYIRNR